MPIEVVLDKENDFILRTLTGRVEPEELTASLEATIAHPDYHAGMRSLSDLRGLTHHFDAADMRALAEFVAAREPRIAGGRNAVVVARPVVYGMMRMLQAHLDQISYTVAIFYDMDEARRWLGVPAASSLADAAGSASASAPT